MDGAVHPITHGSNQHIAHGETHVSMWRRVRYNVMSRDGGSER